MTTKRKRLYSPVHLEALRLMRQKGTVGRHMAGLIGIQHQAYSDIKKERKPFSKSQARAIIRAFGSFSEAVTPRIQDTDAD